MNKKTFIKELAETVHGKAQVITKNGVEYNAIVIMPEMCDAGLSATAPIIYVDDMFAQRLSVEEAAAEVLKLNAKYSAPPIETAKLFGSSKEDFLDNLRFCVQKKSDRNIIKEVFDDVEGYIRVIAPGLGLIAPREGYATYILTEAHLDSIPWDTDIDEIIARAKQNVHEDMSIIGMNEMMIAYGVPAEALPEKEEQYILANTNKWQGAGILLMPEALDQALEKIGVEAAVVLPSSVHELILVPYGNEDIELEQFNSLVQSVNESELIPEEVLADHAFFYSKKEGLKSLASLAVDEENTGKRLP